MEQLTPGWPVVAFAGHRWGVSSCAGRALGVWGFVVEFLEGLLYVAWHGDVNVFFGIVPGEGEATILCSLSID